MTPTVRTGLLIALIAILGVAAVAGWTRTPSPAPAYASNFMQPQSAYGYANQPSAYPNPYATPAAYATPYAPAANCVEPMPVQTVAYTDEVRPVRVVRTNYVQPRRTYVTTTKRGRSWKKSLAIVAGTGGVGAAIGALAGGGRGAAIGALAGGGAGFLYDRLTHNKVN